MIEMPITQGRTVLLDDCDAHLADRPWYVMKAKEYPVGYAIREMKTDGKRHRIFLHHAIIGYPLNGCVVDHKNGNSLDNRRSNLRITTQRENMQNQKCHRIGKKSSRFIGVYWDKNRQKWNSMISINGKRKCLGRFINESEAADAYKKEITQLQEAA